MGSSSCMECPPSGGSLGAAPNGQYPRVCVCVCGSLSRRPWDYRLNEILQETQILQHPQKSPAIMTGGLSYVHPRLPLLPRVSIASGSNRVSPCYPTYTSRKAPRTSRMEKKKAKTQAYAQRLWHDQEAYRQVPGRSQGLKYTAGGGLQETFNAPPPHTPTLPTP